MLDTKDGVIEFVRVLKVEKDESKPYFWSLVNETMSFPAGKRASHLKEHVRKSVERMPTLDGQIWMQDRFVSAAVTYVWPKLDEAVTTHTNHLVKSPFSVHGKTGRVALFVPEDSIWSFSPQNVPCLPSCFHVPCNEQLDFLASVVRESSQALEDVLRSIPPAEERMQDERVRKDVDMEDVVPSLPSPPPPPPPPDPDTQLTSPYYGLLIRAIAVQAVCKEEGGRMYKVGVVWKVPSQTQNKHGPHAVKEGTLFRSKLHPSNRQIVDEILSSHDKLEQLPNGGILPFSPERVVFPLESEADTSFLSLTHKSDCFQILAFSKKQTDKTRERSQFLFRIARVRNGPIIQI